MPEDKGVNTEIKMIGYVNGRRNSKENTPASPVSTLNGLVPSSTIDDSNAPVF